MSTALSICYRPHLSTGARCRRAESNGFVFIMSRQTRYSDRSGLRGCSARPAPTTRALRSASKAASDHLVRAWHHTYGLPTLVTNCSTNYGPRQFPEKLVPRTILNALEGKPLPV